MRLGKQIQIYCLSRNTLWFKLYVKTRKNVTIGINKS